MPPEEIQLPENPPNYEGLPIFEQIRLLQEWAPLISYGQRILATDDAYARTLIVGDALEWLAETKTASKFDERLVEHVAAVVKTKEGESLVRFLVSEVQGGKKP